MWMMVKVRFEDSDKTFEMLLTESETKSLVQQQKSFLEKCDYKCYETRQLHHLFNVDTQLFFLTTSEVKQGIIY
jgi:hypothetical protein